MSEQALNRHQSNEIRLESSSERPRSERGRMQWYFVAALLAILTSSQVKGCGEASCDSLFSAPIQGYLLGILSACLSAFAGVYTEYLMKKKNDSLIGKMCNCTYFRVEYEKGPLWQRLLSWYTFTTWMVVLNLGSTGLLVSWLMKFADNIVKVYSTSMAMLLTMVLSVYLFNFQPTVQLFLGIIICMISLHMYFAPFNMLFDSPATSKWVPGTLKEVVIENQE